MYGYTHMLLCVIRVYKICHLEYPHRYVDVCYETLQLPPYPSPPPFPANSSILVLLSVLYVRQVTLCSWGTEGSSFKPGYVLFILVTMEILVSCIFLIVFIG